MKPLLLDLFCGAGGAAVGYHRAGFDVVGVDINPQPNYPFEFVLYDALTILEQRAGGLMALRSFDAIHASPPCQAYTQLSAKHRGNGTLADERPALIAEVRRLLVSTGLSYVIENVLGASTEMNQPYEVIGEMFGLRVHRPRLFETSFSMGIPPRPKRQKDPIPVYGKLDGRLLWKRKDGTELRAPKRLEVAADAMGIDWMTWDELREAIPPAYTEFVGSQLLEHLAKEREAA